VYPCTPPHPDPRRTEIVRTQPAWAIVRPPYPAHKITASPGQIATHSFAGPAAAARTALLAVLVVSAARIASAAALVLA
jgi:hypothetical protein